MTKFCKCYKQYEQMKVIFCGKFREKGKANKKNS